MALTASDLPAIYSLLTNSMSGDEAVRKPAEIALSQSESRPGFCACLMVLFLTSYASFQVFFMVILEMLMSLLFAPLGGCNCEGFGFSSRCAFNGFGIFEEQY